MQHYTCDPHLENSSSNFPTSFCAASIVFFSLLMFNSISAASLVLTFNCSLNCDTFFSTLSNPSLNSSICSSAFCNLLHKNQSIYSVREYYSDILLKLFQMCVYKGEG